MTHLNEVHPAKEDLRAFVEGLATTSDMDFVEAHISNCEVCMATLDEIDLSVGLVAQLSQAFIQAEVSADRDRSVATIVDGADGYSLESIREFLQPSSDPGSIGRLSHYEILELAGRGTFGVVVKAFDEVLQRSVAIKILSPDLLKTPEARTRFIREARAAAAIRHENVVQIHSVHEAPLPYLVMEFIPGPTVQQTLEDNGPIDPEAARQIGRQIAAGLSAAHACRLIHRDIKPGNILIDPGEELKIKITDFGLARRQEDCSLGQRGVVAGTPMYMSPEQINGEELDARSDLFSLGSVLYAMLAGAPPFRGDNTLSIVKSVCHDIPRPISEIVPTASPKLCEIVHRLLAKLPDERFQSAREVVEELSQCDATASPDERHGNTISLSSNDNSPEPAVLESKIGISPSLEIERRRSADKVAESRTLIAWPSLGKFHNLRGLVVLVLLLGLIVVRTNHSEFVITTDSPEIAARLDSDGGIAVEDRATGKKFHLTAGKNRLPNGDYELSIKSPDGLEFDTPHVKLKRFGSVVATVRAKPIDVPQSIVVDLKTSGNQDPPIPDQNFALHFANLSPGVTVPEFPRQASTVLTLEAFVTVPQTTDPSNPDHQIIVRTPDGDLSWIEGQFSFYTFHRHIRSAVPSALGDRVHVAGINDGQQRRLYVNGKLVASSEDAGELKPFGDRRNFAILIGKNFFGRIDSVRVSRNARYFEEFSAPKKLTSDDDTQALYLFEAGQGDRLVDSSGHDHHGQIAGAVWVHRDGRPVHQSHWKSPAFQQWVDGVSQLNGHAQVDAVATRLQELNPGFDGALDPRIENGVVEKVNFSTKFVTDISPVRAFPGLRCLNGVAAPRQGLLIDLAPLSDLQLTELSCSGNPITDLTPLQKLPLTSLDLSSTLVSDLKQLRDLPLKSLSVGETWVTDLAPLLGMPLTNFTCQGTKVADLSPLKGKSLWRLIIQNTPVHDLSPLSGMPLKELLLSQTFVTDLEPIKSAPLIRLAIDFTPERDALILRSIETLETINKTTADEFWKQHDPNRNLAQFLVNHHATFHCTDRGSGMVLNRIDRRDQIPSGPFVIHQIEMHQTTDVEVKAMVDLAAGLDTLREVIITDTLNTQHVTAATLKQLIRLKSLTTIGLNSTPALKGEDLAILGALPNLRTLNFGATAVGDEFLEHVHKLPQLTSLLLYGFNISDRGVIPLGKSNIQILAINTPTLTDVAGEVFAQMPKLQHLDLRGCRGFTGSCFSHFKNSPLKTLQLGGTAVRESSLKFLVHIPKLEKLLLDDNNLADQALMHLVGLPIQDLEIHDRNITQQGLRQLHEALPNCRITSKYGILAPASAN